MEHREGVEPSAVRFCGPLPLPFGHRCIENGANDRIRIDNILVGSQELYQLSYVCVKIVGEEGVEPSWDFSQKILNLVRLPFRHSPGEYEIMNCGRRGT